MNQKQLIFWSFVTILLFCVIIYWGNYLIRNGYVIEKFTISTGENQMFKESTTGSTSNTVDLPLTTTTSCKNICGPQNTCAITGEQCSYDLECYGCKPLQQQQQQTRARSEDVIRGQNDAGKLTDGTTPTYSSLTTDIGTQSALIDTKAENSEPVQYSQGLNTWRKPFDAAKELYDKRYSPSAQSFLMQYKDRPTLSGQFMDNGPPAANSYM